MHRRMAAGVVQGAGQARQRQRLFRAQRTARCALNQARRGDLSRCPGARFFYFLFLLAIYPVAQVLCSLVYFFF